MAQGFLDGGEADLENAQCAMCFAPWAHTLGTEDDLPYSLGACVHAFHRGCIRSALVTAKREMVLEFVSTFNYSSLPYLCRQVHGFAFFPPSPIAPNFTFVDR